LIVNRNRLCEVQHAFFRVTDTVQERQAMSYTVAVVGATGNVGREMMSILSERQFPVKEVYAIASRRSQGVEVSFGDTTVKCVDLATFDFSKCDFCLMSAGGAVSKEWSPKIAAKGCVVIDNSSAWRYDQDVPLIVPEVNADAVAGYAKKKHHCQSKLLDGAIGCRPEAVARSRHDQARRGGDVSIRFRRRQGSDGRAVVANQGQVCSRPGG
jgi:hypothetical protein